MSTRENIRLIARAPLLLVVTLLKMNYSILLFVTWPDIPTQGIKYQKNTNSDKNVYK